MTKFKKTISTITFLTSFSTLFCCALPALFIALGAGATFAGLVSIAPGIMIFAKYKTVTFAFGGIMLILGGFFRWKEKNKACSLNNKNPQLCSKIKKISKYVYWISVIFYLIGFYFAYVIQFIN